MKQFGRRSKELDVFRAHSLENQKYATVAHLVSVKTSLEDDIGQCVIISKRRLST